MANEKSKKPKNEQKPPPETKPEPIEHKPVVMNTASEQAPAKESAPSSIDKAVRVGKLIEQANEIAVGLKDEGAQFALLELSERIKDVPLDEQGLEDVSAHLREMIAGLQARALVALEAAKLSEAEQKRLEAAYPTVAAKSDAQIAARLSDDHAEHARAAIATSGHPLRDDMVATAAPLPAHVTERIEAIADEKMAVERLRLLASSGETLVQAVERLEALAETGRGLLHMVGGDLKVRAVGVIVEDAPKEGNPDLYRIHVLERGGGELRVWPLQKGEEMPWHAARHEVERLVETRLTPEDRR